MLGWPFFLFIFFCLVFFSPKQMNSLIAGVSHVSRIFLSSINRDSNGIESRGMQRWKKSQGDVSDCDYKVSPRPCRAVEGRQRVRRAFSQAANRRLAALKAAPRLSLCFPRSPHSSLLTPHSVSLSPSNTLLLLTSLLLLFSWLVFALCASRLSISSSISPWWDNKAI